MKLDLQAGITILKVNSKFNTLTSTTYSLSQNYFSLFLQTSQSKALPCKSPLIMTQSSWDSLANSISNEMQRTSA